MLGALLLRDMITMGIHCVLDFLVALRLRSQITHASNETRCEFYFLDSLPFRFLATILFSPDVRGHTLYIHVSTHVII